MKILNCVILVCVLSLATGCSRYRVTLNEQPVFNPPRLFSAYRLTDAALADCVAQAIADGQITRAEALTRLVCSHAGVGKLNGLEIFSSLAYVNLSGNNLTDIRPLMQLPNLNQVDVRKNPRLDCPELAQLAKQVGGNVSGPEHCEK